MSNHSNDNTNLTVFNFKEQPVRVVTINVAPYWVLADVCKPLDLGDPSRVADRLDPDGTTFSRVIDGLGREQEMLCISEPNLYRTIFRSNKPEAKAFQDWVFEEVLPSIRKTGSYNMYDKSPKDQLGMLQFVHKVVHALLCGKCNKALGIMKEDPERIRKLKEYADWCQSLEPKTKIVQLRLVD